MRISIRFILLFSILLSAGALHSSDFPHSKASASVVVTKETTFVNPAQVAGFPQLQASTALNTDTAETLVVWQDWQSTNGSITDASGVATGKRFHNECKSCGNDVHDGAGVAYNPMTKEYLVVFNLLRPGTIYGMRVSSNAKVIGKPFTVVAQSSTSENNHPRLVFNAQTNGFTMVWRRTEGIAAALLDSSGKLSGSIVILKKNPGPNGYVDGEPNLARVMDVKFLSSGTRLLVVFVQRISEKVGDMWLASIDPLLQNVNASNVKRINPQHIAFGQTAYEDGDPYTAFGWDLQGASIALLPDGSAAVFYGDGKSIKKRKINVQGTLAGPPVAAFAAPLANTHLITPRVAVSTTSTGSAGLLIAKDSQVVFGNRNPDHHFLWAQPLDANGSPSGTPVQIHDFAPGTSPIIGAAMIPLPRKASDTLFLFVSFQPQVNANSNIIQLNLTVQP